MPSFDVVSEVDEHELANAVDQANREVGTRFDFKGIDARYEIKGPSVELNAEATFQLKQMLDILRMKMTKRSIDVSCLDVGSATETGRRAIQVATVRQGIETAMAKKMVKRIKDSKMKVQAAIQGEKLRITGKKRDDLQAVMALLREGEFGLPLQFDNFRD
ncbi:MAG: YajQ family cyclic di-GMP-binding protein [Gammaproteobacteria bacterium]